MKNIEILKKKICDQITKYTYEEMYDLLTGDNPFQMLICKRCEEQFGRCPEETKDDQLCKDRFKKWCDM